MTLRTSALGFLLLSLVLSAGCGRKPAESVEPAPKPPTDQPKPTNPTPGKPSEKKSPAPKVAPAKPVEVQFLTDEFADVAVGDGVAVRATCFGREDDRLLLLDAHRHLGSRPALTAPELHATFAKNEKAAGKRFSAKGVIVRGVVVEKAVGRLFLSATEEPKAVKADPGANMAQVKPDHTLTAVQFREAFTVAGARERFAGKVVEVTGTVHRFQSERGRASVMIATGETKFGVTPEMQCYTRDDEPWGKLLPGLKVTLRGVAPLALGSPVLMGCVIVSSEPAQPFVASAAELAADYKAGRDATNKKYAGKLTHVTGEVARTDVTEDGAVRLTLKTGPDLPRVVILFKTVYEDARASDLRPGTKIKAHCMCPGNYEPDELNLGSPLFVFE